MIDVPTQTESHSTPPKSSAQGLNVTFQSHWASNDNCSVWSLWLPPWDSATLSTDHTTSPWFIVPLHTVSWNECAKYWIFYLWSYSASVTILACFICFVNISQPILSHCKERHGTCLSIRKRKLKYREVKYHVQSHAVHRWQSQETFSWVLNPKSCSAIAIWITWGPGIDSLIWAYSKPYTL